MLLAFDNTSPKPYEIMWRSKASCFLLLFVFLQTNLSSFAQTNAYPFDEWVKELSVDDGPVRSGFDDLFAAIKGKDSTEVFGIFNELQKRGNIKNNYFRARFF